jgi:LEA14-like dessication related protein
MNKKLVIGSIVAVGGLSLIFLGTYLNKQYKMLMDGIVKAFTKINGVVIKQLSLSNLQFTLMFKIVNKGDLSVDVTKQSYNLYINNIQVATLVNNNILRISSQSITNFPIDVNLVTKDLLKAGANNLQYILTDKSKIVFKIVGTLTIKAGIITLKNLPIQQTFSLADLVGGGTQQNGEQVTNNSSTPTAQTTSTGN